jgi:mannose-6-phosphate isomerase-like protein (cupin superfamily)
MGFNQSKGELDVAIAYAYDRHEFCYNVRGSAVAYNDGETVNVRAGTFMWRPAGAVTRRVTTADDYASICAFGPARTDGWSHRLSPERIDELRQLTDGPVRPQFRSVDQVPEVPFADGTVHGPVIHRVIFDTPQMVVSHIIFGSDGALAVEAQKREDIYWLESGKALVDARGSSLFLNEGEFLHIRPGEAIEKLTAQGPSVLIRWSAPAGQNGPA